MAHAATFDDSVTITSTGTTVTIGETTPASDRWELAAVEVRAAS